MKIDWNRSKVRIVFDGGVRPPMKEDEISLVLEVDSYRPFVWTGTLSECFRNLGLWLENCERESCIADIPIIRQ